LDGEVAVCRISDPEVPEFDVDFAIVEGWVDIPGEHAEDDVRSEPV
jgi:hypothetical protein